MLLTVASQLLISKSHSVIITESKQAGCSLDHHHIKAKSLESRGDWLTQWRTAQQARARHSKHVCACMHKRTHVHTHTLFSLTYAHTLACSHTHTHSLSLSYVHTHTISLSVCLSVTHTHTGTTKNSHGAVTRTLCDTTTTGGPPPTPSAVHNQVYQAHMAHPSQFSCHPEAVFQHS